jgi:hypothetical protein
MVLAKTMMEPEVATQKSICGVLGNAEEQIFGDFAHIPSLHAEDMTRHDMRSPGSPSPKVKNH